LLGWLLLAGCFAPADSEGDYGYMDDDLPSGERCDTDGATGSSTDGCETGTTTGPPPDGSMGSPCDGSNQCNEGLICSAPFDGERGTFACVPGCIEVMDEARWCADASACCDPGATCSTRGYCMIEGTTGDTSGTTSDRSETSGTTDGADTSGTTTTG
jgi:hypothetical protein